MTTTQEQLAIKDPDGAHPIASAWRPTFRAIVAAFVRGDYTANGIDGVEPVPTKKAEGIRDYVADYGETLIDLPDETWATSIAQWSGSHWRVLVDLWTEGEGRSDLVLDARVHDTESGIRVRIQLVYVP